MSPIFRDTDFTKMGIFFHVMINGCFDDIQEP